MRYAIKNLIPIIVRPPVVENGITVSAAVIVPAGKVINIVEWDGVTRYDPEAGTEIVKWDDIGPDVDGKLVAGSHAALWNEYQTILRTPDPLAVNPAALVSIAAAEVVTEIDKAFTARTTKLSDGEKLAMKDKVVGLIARAQGR
ncbi:MAG: hypothetical protein Q8P23_00805 [bacterium]|nr:hypothetical protein [bacterium]